MRNLTPSREELAAVAKTYTSMHILDFRENRYEAIRSNQWIESLANGYDNMQDAMNNIMSHITEPENRAAVLEFVDFSTLQTRMREDDVISLVFKGTIHGWCRARFIRVGEEKEIDRILFAVENINDEVDPLTGLPWHNNFWEATGRVFDLNSRAQDAPARAVLFIDISKFRLINARYGVEKGDEVLADVAEALKAEFYDGYLARLSADHFAVLTGVDRLEERIWALQSRLRRLECGIPVEVNVGIHVVRDWSIKPELACDLAKAAADSIRFQPGKYVAYYSGAIKKQINIQYYVVSKLDEAMEKGHIHVRLQPVIRTASGTLCGLEALVRWNDPELGMLLPGEFIPALETARMIHKLDTYVVQQVCRLYRSRVDQGLPVVPVSVNLSRLDFVLADIGQGIQDAVMTYRVPREMLNIEITESVFLDDVDNMQKEIRRFHDAGFQVWMDDFGSGYSSLNILKDYEFDEMKIDMAFLSSMSDRAKIIIESAVKMAKKIGIQTLAEGVETEEQFRFLKRIGCEKVQGYLFGKPMTVEECIRHMESTGIHVESPEEARYYDTIGKVDSLKGCATAILEYREGHHGRYLQHNREFLRELNALGVASTTASEHLLASGRNRWGRSLYEGCLKAKETGKPYLLHFVMNSCMEIMNITYLCSLGDRDAYSVDMQQVGDELAGGFSEDNPTMKQLFSMFQSVYLLDLQDGSARPMYRSRAALFNKEIRTMEELIETQLEHTIHPDDRERYRKFMDAETLKARTSAELGESLTEYFRIRQHDDSYRWYGLEFIASGDGHSYAHFARYLRSEWMQTQLEKMAGI